MKKIIDFLKSKKIFSIPKQREILFFDSLNLKLFLPYLKVNGFEILETRKKLINVYVIMKLLCKGKKVDGVNYFLEYIKIVNPKIIISFTDNSIFLYRIKNFFPKIKILVVQNGMRNNIFFNTLKADKTLKSDVIFTWGKNITEKYKKYIKTKTIILGSLKNNQIRKNRKKKRNSIAFISTGYEIKNNYIEISKTKRISDNYYYKPEKILLQMIYKICKEKKIDLEIIGRCREDRRKEKLFYETILGRNKFRYYPQGDKTCYLVSDKARLSINIYSAFGLETLARGNRCCFFNVRGKYCKEKSISCFWPKFNKNKGKFWSDQITLKEIRRVINFGLVSSDDEWKQASKNIYPNLISYNKNNKLFNQTIKKFLI